MQPQRPLPEPAQQRPIWHCNRRILRDIRDAGGATEHSLLLLLLMSLFPDARNRHALVPPVMISDQVCSGSALKGIGLSSPPNTRLSILLPAHGEALLPLECKTKMIYQITPLTHCISFQCQNDTTCHSSNKIWQDLRISSVLHSSTRVTEDGCFVENKHCPRIPAHPIVTSGSGR
jgi:hypothetical protein